MEQAPTQLDGDISAQLVRMMKKIDTLTLEIQALKPKPAGYVKTSLKYAMVIIPAVAVGFAAPT